jgi:general secretion pathway protein F
LPPPAPKPLSFRIRAELYTQLASMETAGLPVDKTFALLRIVGPGHTRLEAMRKLLARGGDPAFAGEKSGLFTRLEAKLIRAALMAGSPARTYQRLADFYTQRAMQLATLKSRMAMPVFVFIAALFIQPLPGLAAGTFSFAGYLVQSLRPLVVIAALAYVAVKLPSWLSGSSSRPSAPTTFDTLLLRIPLFGAMLVRRNAREFFASLALMLEAGISMLDALPGALDTIENSAIRQEFARIRPRVEQGATLAQALAGMSYIGNAQVIALVETGEASGTLPEMLLRHAAMESDSINHFDQQVADWAPRVLYGLVMLWMAYGLLTGQGFMPRVPNDL